MTVNSSSTSLSESRPGCPEALKSEQFQLYTSTHSACLSACPSVCMCLYVCLSVYLPACLPISLSACLSLPTAPVWWGYSGELVTHNYSSLDSSVPPPSPHPPSLLPPLLEALLNCDWVISITPQVATLCLISSLNRVAIIGIHFFPPLSSIPLQECGQVCGYELAQRWYVFI